MYNRIVTLSLLLFGRRVQRNEDTLVKGFQVPYQVQHTYSSILDEYLIIHLN